MKHKIYINKQNTKKNSIYWHLLAPCLNEGHCLSNGSTKGSK